MIQFKWSDLASFHLQIHDVHSLTFSPCSFSLALSLSLFESLFFFLVLSPSLNLCLVLLPAIVFCRTVSSSHLRCLFSESLSLYHKLYQALFLLSDVMIMNVACQTAIGRVGQWLDRAGLGQPDLLSLAQGQGQHCT